MVGSIVLQGIFRKPWLFSRHKKRLNTNGLFPLDDAVLEEYLADYLRFEEPHDLEPVGDILQSLERVYVGRVDI